MNGKALVLGAGPTGLLAARELYDRGFAVTIQAAEMAALPQGPFYFHDLPQSLKDRFAGTTISHVGLGLKETYSIKQWGILYNSSFPGGDGQPRTVFKAWWPHRDIKKALLMYCHMKYEPIQPVLDSLLQLAAQYDFIVLTFPLADRNQPFLYSTPIARVPLQDLKDLLPDFPIRPGWFIYDGRLALAHRDIVRVALPLADYAIGYGWIEMTKTAELPMRWPTQTRYIHDLHPSQKLTTFETELPDHVLVAGRFATGDRRYLASDVLPAIRRRLETI